MLKVVNFIHRYNKLLLVAIMLFLFGSIFMSNFKGFSPAASASTINVKYFKCVTIGTEDSLWSIANDNISEEYESVEDYIKEVKDINDLKDDKIYCGATLVIPHYDAPQ